MADARIEVTCPGCDATFHVAAAEQGHVADCPYCHGWVDVPELGRTPTEIEMEEAAAARTAREYELQSRESSRQLEVAARQLEQYQRFIDRRDQQDARYDRILDRLEGVIGHWELLSARMTAVMERLGTGPATPPQETR